MTFCYVTVLTTRVGLAFVVFLLMLVLQLAELGLHVSDMNVAQQETALCAVAEQLQQLREIKVRVNSPFSLDIDLLLALSPRNRLTVLYLRAYRHTELDP